MKELLKYASGAAIGIVVTLVILSFIRGCINYEINIIDALMLIITTALTIAVVYLGNSLNKRNVARDIISKDFYVILQVKRKCPLKWHIKFKKEALCLSCSLKT